MMTVSFFKADYDPAALTALEEVLRSGWLTSGPKARQFEQEFAAHLGGSDTLHAVAVNSCTAALHLALEAIGLQRGDLVLVPTMTFAATAEVVRYFDAIPVFIDTEADSLNMSVPHLRATLEALRDGREIPGLGVQRGRVRAVIPVHYGGQPCDLAGILAIAAEYGLDVIEDAAHAFPAGWISDDGGRRMVGADTSRITCFSFYANKTITTGEGGMAVTADEALASRMRLMSLHGMNRDAWRRFEADGTWDYQIVAPGFKYNLTDLASAIGLGQLARAEEFRRARERVAAQYDAAFSDLAMVAIPPRRAGILHSHHLYVIRLQLDMLTIDRARFIEELKLRGVLCSVHWRPLHMHPYYIETYGYSSHDYPVAASVWPTIVSLPLYPSMTGEEVAHVIGAVRDVAQTYRS